MPAITDGSLQDSDTQGQGQNIQQQLPAQDQQQLNFMLPAQLRVQMASVGYLANPASTSSAGGSGGASGTNSENAPGTNSSGAGGLGSGGTRAWNVLGQIQPGEVSGQQAMLATGSLQQQGLDALQQPPGGVHSTGAGQTPGQGSAPLTQGHARNAAVGGTVGGEGSSIATPSVVSQEQAQKGKSSLSPGIMSSTFFSG
ncbi:unnamed protein product, partial [Choristocarpus tenellus]